MIPPEPIYHGVLMRGVAEIGGKEPTRPREIHFFIRKESRPEAL
jgi:hypothetical protein